jgi:hypothetical protein
MANQYTDVEDLKFHSFSTGEYKVFRPYDNDEGWYEYIVEMDKGLKLYDGKFNSLYETYNGVKLQRFTKKQAIDAAKRLIKETEEELKSSL